ncbi:MAG: hypothetical protein H6672_01405 [Anaerolineaceae bacterium]|nr:hypothetical protein [Anaerolineaceae bacterium]
MNLLRQGDSIICPRIVVNGADSVYTVSRRSQMLYVMRGRDNVSPAKDSESSAISF